LSSGLVPFTLRTWDDEKFPEPHQEFNFINPRQVVVAEPKGSVNTLELLQMLPIEEGSKTWFASPGDGQCGDD
jgi:hypothetical protein